MYTGAHHDTIALVNWKILPQKSDDLVEQLLYNRDIKTSDQRQKFFHPKLEDYEKNLRIPEISKATERIRKAIKNDELIIAYGDYDVDGIAGAAVLYLGLTMAGAKVLPYIPHREKEGYGLSPLGLEFARDSGATLVITCDTGIVAFEMCKLANELGLDLIITDHHQLLDGKIPDCLAVVHSLDLCGAAVAWCLVRDLLTKSQSEDLLDLVAIATISDMMPLLGVNRAIVKEGLEKLNRTERVGLLELFREAGIVRGEITSYEIGHIIAPRLNAMGRLEHAIDSLRLLCTKDPAKARKLARLIAETNNQRKILTVEAVDEARLMINGSSKKIHVLSSEKWIPGIIGLVAGRVCDETGCSTVAIAIGEEYSKGSARASGGINIVEMLRQCSDILEAVGGHEGAAGFTIQTKKIDELGQRLESLMDDSSAGEAEDRVVQVEAMIPSKSLSLNLIKDIEKLEPFGVNNPKPILATNNMELHELRTVGEGKHLKGKADNVDFIAFGMGDMENILGSGNLVSLVYTMEIDKYNGFEKLQLKVKDMIIG